MPGRNDPCPCGSGQKYKNCCVDRKSGISRGLLVLIAVIAAVAAIGLLPSLFADKDEDRSNAAVNLPVGSPRPQPGAAPPGKVWSAEHGHWHDAAAAVPPGPRRQLSGGSSVSMPTVPKNPAFTPAPQPPGAVPPGKVWSNEHGHWHDLPK